MSDCIFCAIINKSIPAEVVYETEDVLVFPDIRPVAPTHLLVIPKKHLSSLNDAQEADQALLGAMLLAVNQVAQKLGLEDRKSVV